MSEPPPAVAIPSDIAVAPVLRFVELLVGRELERTSATRRLPAALTADDTGAGVFTSVPAIVASHARARAHEQATARALEDMSQTASIALDLLRAACERMPAALHEAPPSIATAAHELQSTTRRTLERIRALIAETTHELAASARDGARYCAAVHELADTLAVERARPLLQAAGETALAAADAATRARWSAPFECVACTASVAPSDARVVLAPMPGQAVCACARPSLCEACGVVYAMSALRQTDASETHGTCPTCRAPFCAETLVSVRQASSPSHKRRRNDSY